MFEVNAAIRNATDDLRFEFDRAVDEMIHENFSLLSSSEKHSILTECQKIFVPAAEAIATLLVNKETKQRATDNS